MRQLAAFPLVFPRPGNLFTSFVWGRAQCEVIFMRPHRASLCQRTITARCNGRCAHDDAACAHHIYSTSGRSLFTRGAHKYAAMCAVLMGVCSMAQHTAWTVCVGSVVIRMVSHPRGKKSEDSNVAEPEPWWHARVF